jgi:hypothetical protein
MGRLRTRHARRRVRRPELTPPARSGPQIGGAPLCLPRPGDPEREAMTSYPASMARPWGCTPMGLSCTCHGPASDLPCTSAGHRAGSCGRSARAGHAARPSAAEARPPLSLTQASKSSSSSRHAAPPARRLACRLACRVRCGSLRPGLVVVRFLLVRGLADVVAGGRVPGSLSLAGRPGPGLPGFAAAVRQCAVDAPESAADPGRSLGSALAHGYEGRTGAGKSRVRWASVALVRLGPWPLAIRRL